MTSQTTFRNKRQAVVIITTDHDKPKPGRITQPTRQKTTVKLPPPNPMWMMVAGMGD